MEVKNTQDKITTALVAGGSAYVLFSQEAATTLVGKLGATGLMLLAGAIALRIIVDAGVTVLKAVSQYKTDRTADNINSKKADKDEGNNIPHIKENES
jgi:hypothetical protein